MNSLKPRRNSLSNSIQDHSVTEQKQDTLTMKYARLRSEFENLQVKHKAEIAQKNQFIVQLQKQLDSNSSSQLIRELQKKLEEAEKALSSAKTNRSNGIGSPYNNLQLYNYSILLPLPNKANKTEDKDGIHLTLGYDDDMVLDLSDNDLDNKSEEIDKYHEIVNSYRELVDQEEKTLEEYKSDNERLLKEKLAALDALESLEVTYKEEERIKLGLINEIDSIKLENANLLQKLGYVEESNVELQDKLENSLLYSNTDNVELTKSVEISNDLRKEISQLKLALRERDLIKEDQLTKTVKELDISQQRCNELSQELNKLKQEFFEMKAENEELERTLSRNLDNAVKMEKHYLQRIEEMENSQYDKDEYLERQSTEDNTFPETNDQDGGIFNLKSLEIDELNLSYDNDSDMENFDIDEFPHNKATTPCLVDSDKDIKKKKADKKHVKYNNVTVKGKIRKFPTFDIKKVKNDEMVRYAEEISSKNEEIRKLKKQSAMKDELEMMLDSFVQSKVALVDEINNRDHTIKNINMEMKRLRYRVSLYEKQILRHNRKL